MNVNYTVFSKIGYVYSTSMQSNFKTNCLSLRTLQFFISNAGENGTCQVSNRSIIYDLHLNKNEVCFLIKAFLR